jgi:hypothetical protein
LIINDLSIKTHENTGNKPEINNKPNMTRYYYNTPADRYKNAQPLIVPFYAEEESPLSELPPVNACKPFSSHSFMRRLSEK